MPCQLSSTMLPSDLDVPRRDHLDAGARRPVRPVPAGPISPDDVVADRRVVADLVEDAAPFVVFDAVVLVDGMNVVDVGPEARAPIVMREVVPNHQPDRPDPLRSAGTPERVVAGELRCTRSRCRRRGSRRRRPGSRGRRCGGPCCAGRSSADRCESRRSDSIAPLSPR